MALEIQDVRRRVNVDEPNYPALAAALGREAVPQLRALVEDDDPAVASKATYVLSLIPTPESFEGLEAAARSRDENVRLAAAAAFRNLTAPPEDTLRRLLADPDPGVRKVALRSTEAVAGDALRADVERMASADPEEGLRRAAQDLLPRLG
jgi:HEAT repeat protein